MKTQSQMRRNRVYGYYYWFWMRHNHSPTYAECAEELGFSSQTIYKYVCGLVDDGKLAFDPKAVHRGIRVMEYDELTRERISA